MGRELTTLLMTFYDIHKAYRTLLKGPPGPPPRPHLRWHEETKRWWCGEDGCIGMHDHGSEAKRGFSSSIGQSAEEVEEAYNYHLYTNAASYRPERVPSFLEVSSDMDKNEGPVRSVGQYVRGIASERLNKKMREGQELTAEDHKMIKDIASLMRPLEEPQTLYRGIREELLNESGEPIRAGDVLTLDSFTSTSRSVKTGEGFGSFSRKGKVITLIELLTQADTEAITLPDMVFFMEYETILNTDQRVEILEVHNYVPMHANDRIVENYIVARVLPND